MSSSTKKIAIVSIFYAVSLTCLTWVVVYFLPTKNVIYSLPAFYLMSIFLAFLASYYLFFSDIVDIQKGKKIIAPGNRDVTKRKILTISFLYSTFFILMFIYEQVSFITFALWPVVIFICLLLIFDRRLIFNVQKSNITPQKTQKYGLRILMTFASFSSMFYLGRFVDKKDSPMQSVFLKGWETIDISVWCLPIALISSLVIADWITTLIMHGNDKNFFKRSDVILFLGIQFLVIIFLFII
jgi:hypothetical protein